MRIVLALTAFMFICVVVAGVNAVRASGIFTSQPDPTELISLYRSQEVVEAWPEQAKQTLSKLIKVQTLSNDTTAFFNKALYELGKILVLIGSLGFLLVVAGFWTFNKTLKQGRALRAT